MFGSKVFVLDAMDFVAIRMSTANLVAYLALSFVIALSALMITPCNVLGGGWAVLASTPNNVVLSGRVIGASGKHAIFVALWDEAGFLEHPVQLVRIERQATPAFRFEVPSGHWAVSAFEDLNDNGVLDMGMFGPKEPNGFWRQFRAWRKPRFADVESMVERDTDRADVQLRK
jgi:hypothetical protein